MDKIMVTVTVQFALDADYDEGGDLSTKYFRQLEAVLEDIESVGVMDGVHFLGTDVISEDDWEMEDEDA